MAHVGSKRKRTDSVVSSTTSTSGIFEQDEEPQGRLSRHIPQRDQMDMDMASFSLRDGDSSFVSQSSFVDDSTHATSLYREVLAEQLLDRPKDGTDVLAFGGGAAEDSRRGGQHHHRASLQPLASVNSMNNSQFAKAKSQSRSTKSHTKPDKILDAPGLPEHDSQYLDWGQHNTIIIGLRNCIYTYNANTSEAAKLLELHPEMTANAVRWCHNDQCAAINITSGETVIYHAEHEKFIRSVKCPMGTLSTIAIRGPMLAAGSNGPEGNAYIFDLRIKDALVQTFRGHKRAVPIVAYCPFEPHYLATGGEDGSVKVWDARRSNNARYEIHGGHQRGVTALHWSPDKRSHLVTAGRDGILNFFNTHKPVVEPDQRMPNHAAAFAERSVKTSSPITDICWAPGTQCIATAHSNGSISRRKLSTLATSESFAPGGINTGIACMSLSPDGYHLVAAQHDEMLKFWTVFDAPQRHVAEQSEAMLFDDALR